MTSNAKSQPAIVALWTALYRYIWAVLPTVIIVRFLLRRYLSPLRKYPGPFIASGSRIWKGSFCHQLLLPTRLTSSASTVWSTYSGHTETDHIHLHETYGIHEPRIPTLCILPEPNRLTNPPGPVVRIAPDELSFSSLNAAKDIFTVGKGFRKTDFYGVFPPPESKSIPILHDNAESLRYSHFHFPKDNFQGPLGSLQLVAAYLLFSVIVSVHSPNPSR
jgi:hypothetical protein